MSHSIASLLTKGAEKPQEHILRVSELVADIKACVEGAFYEVVVQAEISSFKPWRSGHWYFDLKDDQACLPAVMFRGQCSQVKFEVKDGMQVLAKGRVSVYAPQSKMQMVVESLQPDGQGSLALAFEQLKTRLAQEGLFDESAKIPLPTMPRVVGLVTSPQGAALRDMLRVFHQRMPGISIILVGARVQGEGASKEIAQAIKQLDESGLCDVMIVGRGGGSLEDLWAFNEEPVARAIFECKTPIVSAVGHETDFTIADFIADVRCATPTHAAQTVVPDLKTVLEQLSRQEQQLHRFIKAHITKSYLELEKLNKRLKEPHALWMMAAQRLDELSALQESILRKKVTKATLQLKSLLERLEANSPHMGLLKRRRHLEELSARLWRLPIHARFENAVNDVKSGNQKIESMMMLALRSANERLQIVAARLEAMSPLKVMTRGYCVVEDAKGKVLTSVVQVQVHDVITLKMQDGSLNTRVENILPK